MSHILLTGFDAFGGESVNPSWQVAEALHGECIGGMRVVALRLPCVFGHALQALGAALTSEQPAMVLALGQAAGRSDFSIERVAINVDDARIADNFGAQPVDTPVVAGAPAAYFSTLPIKAMVLALREAGLPASVSQTAGTFVCNHLFYGLMHALRSASQVRAGFMHLPLLPAQAARHLLPGQASMALQTQVQGVRIALGCAATRGAAPDLRVAAGAIA